MKIKLVTLMLLANLASVPLLHATPLGPAFTYQGRLNDGGVPANGNYDMIFNLYDAPTNGNVLGSFSIFGAVPVVNGLFNVELNSYGEFGTNAFNGDPRWLQIGVRTNNNNAANPWIYLTPRQALNCTPQAMYAESAHTAAKASMAANVADGAITGSKLAPGAVTWASLGNVPAGLADGIDNDTTYTAGAGLSLSAANQFSVNFAGSGAASAAARADHQHFGSLWSGNVSYGAGLSVTNSSANVAAALYGQQGTGSGFPYVFGGITAGVWGESSQGSGVYGASGYASGAGVVGFGVATNGPNSGVYGASVSSSGVGVRGIASSSTGGTIGVRGESKSSNGYGAAGYATSLAGAATGVYGESSAVNGAGVVGRSTFVSGVGANYGVIGQSDSLWGTGVYGHAASPSGINVGVVGESESSAGVGIIARNTNGVALKVEGTGRIQSDGDSYIFIPATAGYGEYADLGCHHDPTGLTCYNLAWGDNVVNFPMTLPTVLYGQNVVLKSIEIVYDGVDCCGENAHSWISSTKLIETTYDGATNTLINDATPHYPGTDFGRYGYVINHYLNDNSGFLTLQIRHAYVVQFEGDSWLIFRGIKVRLGHK